MTTPIEGEYVPTPHSPPLTGEMKMTDSATNYFDGLSNADYLDNCEDSGVYPPRLIALARIGASVMPWPIDDIAKERERQKTVEGWTIEHDDKHRRGEMAYAAAWYALNAESHDYSDMVGIGNGSVLDHAFEDEFSWCRWPWDRKWWKPKDRRRDLVRAAALLVAEIERLDRAALPKPAEVTT